MAGVPTAGTVPDGGNEARRFTLIIPSRNRNRIINETIRTYAALDDLDEIIIIDDNSDTPYVATLDRTQFDVAIRIIRNDRALGAPSSRNIGIRHSASAYLLFCDDDIFLPKDYGRRCIEVMLATGHPCVSGRITYLREDQPLDAAAAEFGKGQQRQRFDLRRMLVDHGAFAEDGPVPYTHAVFMWRRDVLAEIMFDERLGRGNGYFEEVAPQIALIRKGLSAYVTNATMCFHLPFSRIGGGGNARPDWVRFETAVRNGRLFYREYFPLVKEKYRIRAPTWYCFTLFVLRQMQNQLIRTNFVRLRSRAIRLVKSVIGRRRGVRPPGMGPQGMGRP